MSVYVDTSAWFALASVTDQNHHSARAIYERLVDRDEAMMTTSYVLAETMGLIQRRLGWKPLELFAAAARTIEVVWIEESRHRAAEELLFARHRRAISIVDASGFVVMREFGLDAAFAFDEDFSREGFRVVEVPD